VTTRPALRNALIAAAVVLVAGGCGSSGADPAEQAAPAGLTQAEADQLLAERQVTSLEQPVWTGASAVGSQVHLYEDADTDEPMFALPNPTHEAQLLSFRVLDHDGDRMRVLLPMRPNQSTAWIDEDEVSLHPVEHRAVVDLSDHTLFVYRGLKVVFREPVATGAPSTPTPVGSFYVDFVQYPAPFPEYLNGMISLAAFSEVHQTFGGGIGQLAIHGWSDASVMGQARSNGCIRVTPEMIDRLKPFFEPGTPVEVVA
jgi:lipoprotein-anchoring transpeptidase ErfK/SrfK